MPLEATYEREAVVLILGEQRSGLAHDGQHGHYAGADFRIRAIGDTVPVAK